MKEKEALCTCAKMCYSKNTNDLFVIHSQSNTLGFELSKFDLKKLEMENIPLIDNKIKEINKLKEQISEANEEINS